MLEIKLVTIIRRQILIVRASAGTVFSLSVLLDKNLTVALHWRTCLMND